MGSTENTLKMVLSYGIFRSLIVKKNWFLYHGGFVVNTRTVYSCQIYSKENVRSLNIFFSKQIYVDSYRIKLLQWKFYL